MHSANKLVRFECANCGFSGYCVPNIHLQSCTEPGLIASYNTKQSKNESPSQPAGQIKEQEQTKKAGLQGDQKMCIKIFRIIFVGNSGAGKNSLLTRFIDEKFNPFAEPPAIIQKIYVGLNLVTKDIKVEGNLYIRLEILGTAGLQRFKSLPTSFYCQADAVFFQIRSSEVEKQVIFGEFWRQRVIYQTQILVYKDMKQRSEPAESLFHFEQIYQKFDISLRAGILAKAIISLQYFMRLLRFYHQNLISIFNAIFWRRNQIISCRYFSKQKFFSVGKKVELEYFLMFVFYFRIIPMINNPLLVLFYRLGEVGWQVHSKRNNNKIYIH